MIIIRLALSVLLPCYYYMKPLPISLLKFFFLHLNSQAPLLHSSYILSIDKRLQSTRFDCLYIYTLCLSPQAPYLHPCRISRPTPSSNQSTSTEKMQHFILSVLALLLLPITILAQGTGTGIPPIPTITGAPFKNTTSFAFPSGTALPIPLTSKFTWTLTQTKVFVKAGPTASAAPTVSAAPSAVNRKREAREHARDF